MAPAQKLGQDLPYEGGKGGKKRGKEGKKRVTEGESPTRQIRGRRMRRTNKKLCAKFKRTIDIT